MTKIEVGQYYNIGNAGDGWPYVRVLEIFPAIRDGKEIDIVVCQQKNTHYGCFWDWCPRYAACNKTCHCFTNTLAAREFELLPELIGILNT
jgi:hypothetical protein